MLTFGLFLLPLSCSAARRVIAALPFLLFHLPVPGAFRWTIADDDDGGRLGYSLFYLPLLMKAMRIAAGSQPPLYRYGISQYSRRYEPADHGIMRIATDSLTWRRGATPHLP